MDLALIPISRNQNSQLRYNPICIWDKDISGTVHSFSMKSSGTLGNCLFVIGKKGTIFVDSIDITVLQSVLFLRMALIFFFRHIKLLRSFLVASSQKCSERQFQIQILSVLLCFRRSLLIVVTKNIFKNEIFFHDNWEKRAMLWDKKCKIIFCSYDIKLCPTLTCRS